MPQEGLGPTPLLAMGQGSYLLGLRTPFLHHLEPVAGGRALLMLENSLSPSSLDLSLADPQAPLLCFERLVITQAPCPIVRLAGNYS